MNCKNNINKGICIIITISMFFILFCNNLIESNNNIVSESNTVKETVLSNDEIYVNNVLEISKDIEKIIQIQSQEEFREETKYVNNEVMFIRKEIRKVGYESQSLNYNDELCKKNKLNLLTVVSEHVNSIYDEYIELYVTYKARTINNVWSVVDKLNQEDDIICAEPNYIYEVDSVVEDKVNYQVAYDKVPTSEDAIYMEYQWYLDELNMKNNWTNMINKNIVPGKGVTVAIIDTGISLTHQALKNALWKNKLEIPGNNVDDDKNGYIDDVYGINAINYRQQPDDDCGHGTHVAGIIAMQPENSGVGIAYGANIMALKAGDGRGNFQQSRIVECINYAVKNNVDIINMSFAGGYSASVEVAVKNAYNQNVLLVGAAGNEGAPTSDGAVKLHSKANVFDNYPAGSQYVIGVMAYDKNNQLCKFSNWDYQAGVGVDYEFIAPGAWIYSTYVGGEWKFQYLEGTSMATPMVSGMLACLRSIYPSKIKHGNAYLTNKLKSNSYVAYRDMLGTQHNFMKMNVDLTTSINNRDKIDLEACDIKLSKDYYVYDGKSKVNGVTVKFGNTVLTKGVHYKLEYSNTTNIGKATVVIKPIASANVIGTVVKTYRITPPKLTGVKVASYGVNFIKLKWNKSKYADGYEVLRYNSESNSYVLVSRINSSNTLTFTNTSLTAGTTYQYKVRCFKMVNNERICAPTVIKKSSTIPDKVKLTYNTTSQSAIKLQWKNVNGASGYQIYQYNSKKKKYVKIKTVGAKTVSFVNTGLKTNKAYYYTVRAYKNWGSKKIYGSFANKMKAYTGPRKITNLTGVKYGQGKVKLKWKRSSNASGYEVYVAQNINGPYEYACRLSGQYDGMIVSNVPSGILYYKVRTYNIKEGKRVYSGLSSAVAVTM